MDGAFIAVDLDVGEVNADSIQSCYPFAGGVPYFIYNDTVVAFGFADALAIEPEEGIEGEGICSWIPFQEVLDYAVAVGEE